MTGKIMINFLNISVLKASSFLLFIFLLQFSAPAEIRYVSKTGTSIPPYTSWETAADSIVKCVNVCHYGDTIFVGNGIYREEIPLIEGLSLIGAGMDSCIIDVSQISPGENIAIGMLDNCLVQNFKIILDKHVTPNGVGIYTRDSVEGCVIQYNKIQYATEGIWLSSGVVRHNFLELVEWGVTCVTNDNSHDYLAYIDSNYISFYHYAIDMFNLTKVIATGNIFKFESINPGGTILHNDMWGAPNPIFNNNIILPPTYNLMNGRAIVSSYAGTYKNNVFMTRYRDVFYTVPSTIINNVIVGSQNAVYGNYGTVKYNNFWKVNSYPNDSTNISVDPMFVKDTSDYHLQMYSLLIDAGDPSILDKDGSRSDIGAYGGPYGESYTYQDLPPRTPVNFYAGLYSEHILLSWNKNTESDFKSYRIYRDTIPGTHNLLVELQDTVFKDQIPSSANRLYYKVSAVDSQGNESAATAEIIFFLSGINEKQLLMNDYTLYQNYPNPFNPSTRIDYQVK